MELVAAVLLAWVGLSVLAAVVWALTARRHRPDLVAGADHVIKVCGRLGEAEALAVRDAAAQLAERFRGRPVVIDVSAITYFDGTALALLTAVGSGPLPQLVGLEEAALRLVGLGEEQPTADVRLSAVVGADRCSAVVTARRGGGLATAGSLDLRSTVARMADPGTDLYLDLSSCPMLAPCDALEIADVAQDWASRTGRSVVLQGVAQAARETLRLAGMPASVRLA